MFYRNTCVTIIDHWPCGHLVRTHIYRDGVSTGLPISEQLEQSQGCQGTPWRAGSVSSHVLDKLDDSGVPIHSYKCKTCKPVLKGAPSLHLFLGGVAAHDGGDVVNSGFGCNVLRNRWRWSNASKGLALRFAKIQLSPFPFDDLNVNLDSGHPEPILGRRQSVAQHVPSSHHLVQHLDRWLRYRDLEKLKSLYFIPWVPPSS